MVDGACMNLLAGYTDSMFQDFESYFRTNVDLVEHDIGLVLKVFNSSFSTQELPPYIFFLRNSLTSFQGIFRLKKMPSIPLPSVMMTLARKLNWL